MEPEAKKGVSDDRPLGQPSEGPSPRPPLQEPRAGWRVRAGKEAPSHHMALWGQL